MTKDSIIDDYADLFCKVLEADLVHYCELGDYQEAYLLSLIRPNLTKQNIHDTEYWGNNIQIVFYDGDYGSCSGCDELEACNYQMEYKDALNYCNDFKPHLIIPLKYYGLARQLIAKFVLDYAFKQLGNHYKDEYTVKYVTEAVTGTIEKLEEYYNQYLELSKEESND